MNYYQPSQKIDTGKWHFTRTNDGYTIPVGYCADDCDGHDTPDEARAHYRDYELDNARFDGHTVGSRHQCAICGEWTDRFASLGPGLMATFTLCDEHCNREELAKVYAGSGNMIASY